MVFSVEMAPPYKLPGEIEFFKSEQNSHDQHNGAWTQTLVLNWASCIMIKLKQVITFQWDFSAFTIFSAVPVLLNNFDSSL